MSSREINRTADGYGDCFTLLISEPKISNPIFQKPYPIENGIFKLFISPQSNEPIRKLRFPSTGQALRSPFLYQFAVPTPTNYFKINNKMKNAAVAVTFLGLREPLCPPIAHCELQHKYLNF